MQKYLLDFIWISPFIQIVILMNSKCYCSAAQNFIVQCLGVLENLQCCHYWNYNSSTIFGVVINQWNSNQRIKPENKQHIIVNAYGTRIPLKTPLWCRYLCFYHGIRTQRVFSSFNIEMKELYFLCTCSAASATMQRKSITQEFILQTKWKWGNICHTWLGFAVLWTEVS